MHQRQTQRDLDFQRAVDYAERMSLTAARTQLEQSGNVNQQSSSTMRELMRCGGPRPRPATPTGDPQMRVVVARD